MTADGTTYARYPIKTLDRPFCSDAETFNSRANWKNGPQPQSIRETIMIQTFAAMTQLCPAAVALRDGHTGHWRPR